MYISNIVIREMNIEDLDKISSILQSDFDDFWNYNIFKQELENSASKYICATYNNKIIGFAGIWICINEAHVTNIVIKKNFRGNGIGKLLLKELIKISNSLKLTNITLEVNENNKIAISLYQKLGFDILGKRKKYYNGVDSALIMTKILRSDTH